MNSSATIQPGAKVRLRFRLQLADGTVIDETKPDELFEFVIGDGSLVDGLEQRLIDLSAGNSVTFNIPAEEGVFGFPDPENVRRMPRGEFSALTELAPGNVVGFELPNGDEVLGLVVGLDGSDVTVDFNHPLIGRDFTFNVTVESVEVGP